MSILIAVLTLVLGVIGVFRPSFFYRSELLSAQQIERNKRIWNTCGAFLIVIGLGLLVLGFFVK